MLELAARLILGGVLLGSAAAKLARPDATSAAMSTYGFASRSSQWLAWTFAVGAELVLALGVAAGSEQAAYAAAGLLLLFAATLGSALLRGRAGAPCACFGPASRVSGLAVVRNLALAAALLALPRIPTGSPSTDEWLAAGLVLALVACAGLAVAVLALAREVGMLRLRVGPSSALEIAAEGPELGTRVELAGRFPAGPATQLAVAAFSSPGCRVCRALRPAVDSLRSEPSLSVLEFDEAVDSDVWESLGIPGAPYALVMDLEGRVLAKGTFNNLAQLESLLATSERRRAGGERMEIVGG